MLRSFPILTSAARCATALGIVLALAALRPLAADAQMHPAQSGGASAATIRPGDRAVDGAALWTGDRHARLLRVVGGAEREAGTMDTRIAPITDAGRAALLVVTTFGSAERGVTVDSTVVDRATLAPVRHRSHNAQRDMALDFAPGRVTGSYVAHDSAAKAIDYPLDRPIFDSAIIDLVIAALPLRVGYAARVPAYIYELGGASTFELSVPAKTAWDGREAWQAVMAFSRGTITWYVDTHTREVLGWSRTLADGSATKVVR